METLLQDLRYAARSLRKSPGFTLVAVLTLALGIGANTAIFSVVNAVLLRPLPYVESERLVGLEGMSYKGEYLELRTRARTLGMAAFQGAERSLTGAGEPVRLAGAAASPEFFSVLGAAPLLGRSFAPDETRPGDERTVVLSYGLWQERFGGEPEIIGQAIRLDGEPYTVIGVMPAEFAFPGPETRIWTPMQIDPADRIGLWSTSAHLIGRLRPGATLEEARAEIRALAPTMRELFPWNMPAEYGTTTDVVPLQERIVGESRLLLLVLLGAVGLVMLVACANLANLLLARSASRRREISVRAALGASPTRLVQQVLTESLLLALVGAAAGLLLASWGVSQSAAWLPADVPRVSEIGIDGRVLSFVLVLGLGTGLLFGVLPALRAARTDPRSGLGAGTRVAGEGRRSVAGALVMTEVALATVLVIGAGLMTRSFVTLLREAPGFAAESVVTAEVAPPDFRYDDDAARRGFYDELLGRLAALPGVRTAAVTERLPFAGPAYGSVFIVEGRPDPATAGGDWPLVDARSTVSDDYFRTLGIPLVRGRSFAPADRADAPPVALVSESLAREYWPDEDPVGKRIRFPGPPQWITIVGIVADVKYSELSEAAPSALYLPLQQAPIAGPMRVAVRTGGVPEAPAAGLRAIVASIDPDTPVGDIAMLDQLIGRSLARPRLAMVLIGTFALVALLLGALGIYGVLAHAVGQRTHEVGVRMALGAQASDVTTIVVRQGLVLAGAGLGAGLIGALLAARLIRGLLYGVAPSDPLTFLAVSAVFLATALLASWIPARRAARVDPMVALRAE